MGSSFALVTKLHNEARYAPDAYRFAKDVMEISKTSRDLEEIDWEEVGKGHTIFRLTVRVKKDRQLTAQEVQPLLNKAGVELVSLTEQF